MSGRFTYHVEFSPGLAVQGMSMLCTFSPVFATRRRAIRYARSLPVGTKWEVVQSVLVAKTVERGSVRAKP